MLGQLGYSVVAISGGELAVELVGARPDRIAAVLLDLVMPGMNGAETFRHLATIREDLPVVVCTGFAAEKHLDPEMKRRIAGLVRKPFAPADLARALEAAGVSPTRPARPAR
jgi:CheY-like chemotaxis protein